ncbi:MAG: neutral/alkaline non-lysosomal ceramidase N-terminal domain-containing protein, partial [Anaerolineae bacterium]|nr:neutral/alkaline non-lysosomal ceramidase N-terminal domain-containing protein [Anaerolineae bacterium]
MPTPTVQSSYTRCLFGVAVRDVTPPVGIYARTWGAAAHDAAEGIHRPMTATAAVFRPLNGDGPTLALVALDLGWFQHLQDEQRLRQAVLARTGLTPDALLVNLSHTHAGPNVNSMLTDVPGSDLVPAYLARLTDAVGDVVLAALDTLAPAWIVWGQGRCALAANRDFWDEAAGRYACGFNPAAPADDTVMVGRVTGDDGTVRATLFNYACHPTTLAWDNRLISPDFVGAAREVLEQAFDAPALFLQGASGELAPRDGYVGDPAVADRNGRQLGYAAAAALEALPPPASQFVYTGLMPSGADLGTWAHQPLDDEQMEAAQRLGARLGEVELQRKPLPSVEELRTAMAATQNRREQEKLRRRLFIQQTLGADPVHRMPVWTWRLGQAALVAVPNEPYSRLQQALRERFPGQ